MRIVVKGNDANINLVFPTALICNRFSAWSVSLCCTKVISKYCKSAEKALSRSQLRSMLMSASRQLNRFRKKHRGWVLVEAESDGYKVVIKL